MKTERIWLLLMLRVHAWLERCCLHLHFIKVELELRSADVRHLSPGVRRWREENIRRVRGASRYH